jgi:ABC-type Mn2+/Zn2+ transport system permease subunit
MIEWLTEPLTYGFIVRGLAAAILTGIACAVLSAFVVWRGMAFVGDAIAHAILPGIVLAFIAGVSLFAGALVTAVLVAALIGWLSRHGDIREDTAIGVVFTGFFALGILLMSIVTSYQDLTHILFGDILGVSRSDLGIMVAIMAIVLVAVFLFYKELVVTSFDPGHSVAIGLSPELVRYGLLLLIALTVVAAIQVVGVVLVLALLITPAAAASQLAKRLPAIMGLGVVFSVLSALVGFYASYYANVASGPAVVLTLTVIFLLTLLARTIRHRLA